MKFLSPQVLLTVGVVLFFLGSLHLWRPLAQADRRAFMKLHRWMQPAVPFFRLLWPVGTLAGILTAAIGITIWHSWRRGAMLLLAYAIVVLGEMALKRRVARQRPFQVLPDARMAQPRQPEDTSFPSGDALRVWLMACALGAWLPSPWCWLLAGVATLVSLGRIALGVHFPLDVIGGAGLGLVAAALAVWLGG